MPRGKQSKAPSQEVGLDSLFQQELSSVNEDIRRKAALGAFAKLRPNNNITVEQFLTGLQRHKEMWAVVAGLGVVDFAETLMGGGRKSTAGSAPKARRTRLSDEQKNALKSVTLRALEGKSAGFSRTELAAAIASGNQTPAGIERAELADKLRQPLHELLTERKLHTVGEKRLMKYFFGGKKGK